MRVWKSTSKRCPEVAGLDQKRLKMKHRKPLWVMMNQVTKERKMSKKTETKTPPQEAETKELAAKESQLPAEVMGEWGQGSPAINASDIVIANILPMQMMSKKVAAKKAAYGEFRDTIENKLLGSEEKPMEFIPFHMEKVWLQFITPKGANKKQFHSFLPMNPSNEDLPYEEEVDDGAIMHRDRSYHVYVLLPSELEEGGAMPYVIPFRRTSRKAGQQLVTQMYVKNLQAGLSPAAFVMKLTGESTTNDEGTFIVLGVEKGRRATNDEQMAALEWFKTVRKGKTKVDDSEFREEIAEDLAGNVDTTDEVGDF